jgi:hypothetical protein
MVEVGMYMKIEKEQNNELSQIAHRRSDYSHH